MPVFSLYFLLFLVSERNRTPGCLAQKRCSNVFGKSGTVQRLIGGILELIMPGILTFFVALESQTTVCEGSAEMCSG